MSFWALFGISIGGVFGVYLIVTIAMVAKKRMTLRSAIKWFLIVFLLAAIIGWLGFMGYHFVSTGNIPLPPCAGNGCHG
jgi:hypothetical protein